jgi:hypothetical protein
LREEQIVAEPLAGAEDGAQRLWDREGDEEVAGGQEPCSLLAAPLLSLGVTALIAGAMPAAVIGEAGPISTT